MALAVAFSGIAALSMGSGRTAHYMVKGSVGDRLQGVSLCNVLKKSDIAALALRHPHHLG